MSFPTTVLTLTGRSELLGVRPSGAQIDQGTSTKITPLCMGDGKRRGNATSQVQFPKTRFHPQLPPLPWTGAARGSPTGPAGAAWPAASLPTPSVPSSACCAFRSRRVQCQSVGVWIPPLLPDRCCYVLLQSVAPVYTGGGGRMGVHQGDWWSREAPAWGAKFRSGDTKNLRNIFIKVNFT